MYIIQQAHDYDQTLWDLAGVKCTLKSRKGFYRWAQGRADREKSLKNNLMQYRKAFLLANARLEQLNADRVVIMAVYDPEIERECAWEQQNMDDLGDPNWIPFDIFEAKRGEDSARDI
jgi:hypothetical protein